VQLKVLCDILADAAAKRGQQQLGGGHAVVAAAIFGGLIDHQAMLAGLGDETCALCVLKSNLQSLNLRGHQVKCKRGAIQEAPGNSLF
jgi:hypothetical protein